MNHESTVVLFGMVKNVALHGRGSTKRPIPFMVGYAALDYVLTSPINTSQVLNKMAEICGNRKGRKSGE